MTLSVKLTNGTHEIDLVYNASSQTTYALQYGGRITPPEPAVLLHQSPDGDSLPVRAYDQDREAYFSLDIIGTDQDELLEKIAELRRWIDGADQQALRSYFGADIAPIHLRILPDGATNATLHRVKWGWIDDGGAFYQSTQLATGKLAPDVVIMLHLEPYGVSENSLTLRNFLPSSPHMVEDFNEDGIPDGWQAANSATLIRSTNHWLVGGYGLKLSVNDSSGQGAITWPTVGITTTDDVVAYVWIASQYTSNDIVWIWLMDGGGDGLLFVEFNPANPVGYDHKITSPPGGTLTWYRYSMSHSDTRDEAEIKILVTRDASKATKACNYYIDAACVTLDEYWTSELEESMAWSSCEYIFARGDMMINEEKYICYVDTWGLPGDIPALLTFRANPTNIGAWARCYLASDRGDLWPIGRDIDFWYDDGYLSFSEVGSGSWAAPTSDTQRTGDQYRRYSGGVQNDTFTVRLQLTGEIAQAMTQSDKRMLIIARGSAVSDVQLRPAVQDIPQADYRNLTANNTWEILDLGIIKTQGLIPLNCPPGGTLTLNIDLVGTITGSSSGTFDMDAMILFPTETFLVHQTKQSTGNVYYDGRVGIVSYINGAISYDALGTFPTLAPGMVSTRLIYLPVGDDGDYDPDAYARTWIYAWPRTRHLLGVK